MISIIAAIGRNRELGKDNSLLWSLPADMKFFRSTTKGKSILMGRKTFESIGRPLPDRQNIVITRNPDYRADGVEIANSLNQALQIAKSEEVFIIGGAEIYDLALPKADKLYLTQIDADFKEADTFFPEIDLSHWQESSRKFYEKDEENIYKMTFTVYEKI